MSHDARVRYDVFGTSASEKTLTGSFVADAKAVILADGFRDCLLNISFTPGTDGEHALIQVETSSDGTNFFLWSENNYPDAAPATKLGISGTPYIVPEDLTTTHAVNYKRSYSLGPQTKYLRFSAKSDVGSSFGTLWVEVWLSER